MIKSFTQDLLTHFISILSLISAIKGRKSAAFGEITMNASLKPALLVSLIRPF